MSQSLAKVYIHIIFSTKYGEKTIREELRKELQKYIVGTLSQLGSYTEELYSNPDHMHILCTLPRTIPISELVSKTKTSSSKLMKKKGVSNFQWQEGYAVFSVSASKVETVKKYILNQPEHHKKKLFKDELRLFFSEYSVDFDERFVWV